MYTEDSIYWIIYIFVIKWSNKSQFTPEYASVFPGNCPVLSMFSSPFRLRVIKLHIKQIAFWHILSSGASIKISRSQTSKIQLDKPKGLHLAQYTEAFLFSTSKIISWEGKVEIKSQTGIPVVYRLHLYIHISRQKQSGNESIGYLNSGN